MTDIVEEARALLAQATPGQWRVSRDCKRLSWWICADTTREANFPIAHIGANHAERVQMANAEFIAAAPRLLAAFADECERLRADLARVTAERDEAIAIYGVSDHQRDEACRDRDRAMAERDAARADISRMDRALADERAAVAIAHERIAEVTAERDARPEISREDAAGYLVAISRTFGGDPEPYERTMRAIRAHAAEASEPSPPPTAPPLLEWGPDGPRLSEYERKRLERDEASGGVCDECGGYLYVGEYGSLGMCPACNGTGRAGGTNA